MMSPSSSRRAPPLVLVLSGPSGVGKDFVVKHLKDRGLALTYITTNTTRPKRPDEKEDVHYHFVTLAEFERMIKRGELLEHAQVYDHWYGVSKKPIREALSQGQDVLIKTDVQGARSIKKALPGAVLIFLTVPSMASLERRLRQRNSESPADLALRLKTASQELAELPLFDYAVVNADGEIERVVSDIQAIIIAEKLRANPRECRLS